jgi:hypothetical protein
MLEINEQQATLSANKMTSFFDKFTRIDEYMRMKKIERVENSVHALPGYEPEKDLFLDFSMHPNDMEFVIENASMTKYSQYLELTSSHCNEKNIPGRGMQWIVYEKTSNKVVGMIRFGSPVINSKPRNEFLGKPLDTKNKELMRRFNDSTIMGFTIVPAQPFGFNYLGGKLLAGICCSHYARRILNKKYDTSYCMFETTSLYGSTKASSQYDGMRPFLRYAGLTDSKFVPAMDDDTYHSLYQTFCDWNDGVHLVSNDKNSKKLKRSGMMIGITKKALKRYNPDLWERFCKTIQTATELTEQKRTYISTYGYSNVADYINLKTDTLEKRENFDRFELENIITWWKNKASKRYESLQKDGRLRNELEIWTPETTDLEIIR